MSEAVPDSMPVPRFERIGPLDIVGLPKNYTSETRTQIPLLWERFVKWIGHVPHQIDNVTYGVIRNNDKGRGFYYMAGVAVSATTAVLTIYAWCSYQNRITLCFTHHGPISGLFETMCAIYTQWVPTATDILADSPCFEKYSADFDPRTGQGTIEIWLPLLEPEAEAEAEIDE